MEPAQMLYLALDILEVAFGDTYDFTARTLAPLTHLQNLADFFQREAQRLGMSNEAQPVELGLAVKAVARLLALRLRKQPPALVESNRLDADPALLGQLTNLHR